MPDARIFDGAFTDKATGHGIGLALSHRIITRQGGTISARENTPRGAVFEFALPLDRSIRLVHGPAELGDERACGLDSGFDGTVDDHAVPAAGVVGTSEFQPGVGLLEQAPAVEELAGLQGRPGLAGPFVGDPVVTSAVDDLQVVAARR